MENATPTRAWLVKLVMTYSLNKCVNPELQANVLSASGLVEIINKYKEDICDNDIDRAILCTDDLEPFLRYKYPILRLRYFWEEKDLPKKLYLMASVLLYHCCINSITGAVEADICDKLARHEREMILKYCESLTEMEITSNNVEIAIRQACEQVPPPGVKKRRSPTPKPSKPLDDLTSEAETNGTQSRKASTLTFKSSVTVMSSCLTESPSYSKTCLIPDSSNETSDTYTLRLDDYSGTTTMDSNELHMCNESDKEQEGDAKNKVQDAAKENKKGQKKEDPCACTANSTDICCATIIPDCANCTKSSEKRCSWLTTLRNSSIQKLDCLKNKFNDSMFRRKDNKKMIYWIIGIIAVVLLIILFICLVYLLFFNKKGTTTSLDDESQNLLGRAGISPFAYHPTWAWHCNNSLCIKVYQPQNRSDTYTALSRCILICSGPQIWPHPIGLTYFSKDLVALATDRLEYKFVSIPSDVVNQYLAEAFKLFLGDLARLERIDVKNRNRSRDIQVKKMVLMIEVESDYDPRMRMNTDESYNLKLEADSERIKINIVSPSFCGVRHGLETLSQIILLDQSSGYLITVSEAVIKDSPSYRYRGLMLDTARNYIPLPDILRTIDAMATCKLNTFHWRISDSASFPLLLPTLSNLFEYGAYDRSMVYSKDDVKTVVNRAGVRGIRVLIEVAIPGPVGRAWSWSDDATCPMKNDNYTCDNVICLRLKMRERVFDVIQHIYSEILEMTRVDDIFHMSDSVFSLSNCYYLINEREGFLEKALERLKLANKGFLPKLPVIWYTSHLNQEVEARFWDRYGVQLHAWPTQPDRSLAKYKVIHSSRWDLSCEIKKQRCTKYRSWQEMYAWKSWRTIEVLSIEGGEAILWTDIVDAGNLDYHLWPRAAAVAERLWSDLVANATAGGDVYMRLDSHRWRMLLRGMKVQPIWPVWCSFNPHACLAKLQSWGNS
ncbi:chitooligosaccharidolytic beta-N-acetylglucosaminidase-like [Pectinophora gossypiella]|uniref:chitooligosaccharidolytic beta-N-acetylglucosaminidase-like n=1 Tax=Pectinophora gossypiella TaxID=13191 RepID=UPI00214E80EB|nr:chitooligosaccharidolytic beta-N-acetylglucosaminidase-like [Pectinophora gossypiella]